MSLSLTGRRAAVVALAPLAALVALALAAAPAAAHAVLIGTQPERGSVVSDALEAVVLQFNEPVGFAQVQVTGPGAERVEDGLPVERGDTVAQPLVPLTERGTYTVAFRVVSDDGHPVEDTFEFTYDGPVIRAAGEEDTPPAEGPHPLEDVDGDPGLIEEEEEGVDDAPVDPEERGEVDIGYLVLALGLLVLVGLGLGAWFLTRRRGGR